MKKVIGLLVFLVLLGSCAALVSSGAKHATVATPGTVYVAPDTAPVPDVTTPDVTVAPAPAGPIETAGQANARQSAVDYLNSGSFSRAGLIEQLSSAAGEGFSVADATYGVDAGNTDWTAQACLSAKDYLSSGSFSHAGLVEQLSSSAGEGFTPAQAESGVTCAGL